MSKKSSNVISPDPSSENVWHILSANGFTCNSGNSFTVSQTNLWMKRRPQERACQHLCADKPQAPPPPPPPRPQRNAPTRHTHFISLISSHGISAVNSSSVSAMNRFRAWIISFFVKNVQSCIAVVDRRLFHCGNREKRTVNGKHAGQGPRVTTWEGRKKMQTRVDVSLREFVCFLHVATGSNTRSTYAGVCHVHWFF